MTQTDKDKPIVFVSHVEEDAAVASKIKNWLEDNLLEGVEVFVSSDKGINPGDKWEERIIEKLRNCRIALILCTQMSVRQPWVNFEAGGALVKGARVIPLCYHGQRKGTLPRPLSSLEALDLSEPDDVSELLEVIAEEVGLRAPEIDPKGLIERLPQRNYEELAADGKLPDIRAGVNLAMAP
ncbi:MAG: toll/interleukin-1 receptor domain-containing protein, partial [Thermoplasmatales archaeon]|nr:toll/interleukin-1 receptor domain-containing protein [Thermoplasmatales archaeon]